jgi:capsid protein
MNAPELLHSLITGQWRVDRKMAQDQERFLAATNGKRELLLRGHEMMARLSEERLKLFAGAEPGQDRPMPNVLSTPEDYKQAYQRYIMMRAARQMEEDYGFFDGMLQDFEDFDIGDELVYQPNTGNAEANRVLRDHVEMCMERADYAQQHDLTKIAQLFVRSMKRDGECGAMPVDTGEMIQLHLVSGDCIGNPLVGANIGPFNYNGIITDEATGEIVSYRLFKRIPKLNCYMFAKEIPASMFWHFADQYSMQQYHGVTVFKNTIRDAFDIDQILNWSKLNMKWRASQLPTVHTETGRPRGAGIGQWGMGYGNGAAQATTPGGAPAPLSVQVDGVVTNYLKLDEQTIEYPNDFPNAQLKVTMDELRRECAKGAKLPYEFVYRADNGGVVQRFWVNKAERTFARDKHLIRRKLLNPFKNRNIQKGIDTGFLDLSKFGTLSEDPARFKGAWQMGRGVSVDYLNETKADIQQIDAALMSPQDFCRDSGHDPDDIRREISEHAEWVLSEAQKIATRLNLDPAFVVAFIQKKFPNPGAGITSNNADIQPGAGTTVPVEAE